MKTILVPTIRLTVVATALFVSAINASAAADAAAEQLKITGAIPVKSAGPYVETGTLRIQVSTKLGRPSTVLPDGTWLYDNHVVNASEARGTLVIRFNRGRVSELALVSPAIAVAMRNNPQKPIGASLVASK